MFVEGKCKHKILDFLLQSTHTHTPILLWVHKKFILALNPFETEVSVAQLRLSLFITRLRILGFVFFLFFLIRSKITHFRDSTLNLIAQKRSISLFWLAKRHLLCLCKSVLVSRKWLGQFFLARFKVVTIFTISIMSKQASTWCIGLSRFWHSVPSLIKAVLSALCKSTSSKLLEVN